MVTTRLQTTLSSRLLFIHLQSIFLDCVSMTELRMTEDDPTACCYCHPTSQFFRTTEEMLEPFP